MKTKKAMQYLFLGMCSFLLFSCSVTDIIKKKYRPGFYIAHKGEKTLPVAKSSKAQKSKNIHTAQGELKTVKEFNSPNNNVFQLNSGSFYNAKATQEKNARDNFTASITAKNKSKAKNQTRNFYVKEEAQHTQTFSPQYVFDPVSENASKSPLKLIWAI